MTDLVSNLAADLVRLGLANALATTLLAGLVGVLTFPLRRKRPALVHALWLLVLLKLVTPPLWTLPLPWPAATTTTSSTTHAEVEFVTLTEEEVRELLAAEEAASTPAPRPAPPPVPPTDWPRIAMASLALAWLAGSSLCLTLFVVRSWRFARLLRHATPAPPDARRQAERIAARLGVRRCPGVWFVPGAVCPMLWAVAGDARLLLPRGLWDRLDAAQRDTLLAHELAHLLRRDHWVRLLEVAATVLYWWHPVLWWARRGLREAEEQCCDAWVVWSMPAAVRHYMSAILEAVEYVSDPNGSDPNPTGAAKVARPAVPTLASGMGEFRRLERRLWMIRQNESPRRLGRPALLGVVLAAAAALPLAPTMARQDDVEEAPATTEPRQQETRAVIVRQATPTQAADVVVDEAGVETPVRVFSVDGKAITVTSDVRTTESAADDGKGLGADVLIAVKEPQTVREYHVSNRLDKDDPKSRDARIQQARYEVEMAAANLAVAKQRLAQLEQGGGDDDVRSGVTFKKGDPKHYVTVKPSSSAAATTVRMKSAEKGDKAPHTNYEGGKAGDRLDQLEQKLEKIDRLLGKLLEEKGDKPKEKEKPASYDPGPRVF